MCMGFKTIMKWSIGNIEVITMRGVIEISGILEIIGISFIIDIIEALRISRTTAILGNH